MPAQKNSITRKGIAATPATPATPPEPQTPPKKAKVRLNTIHDYRTGKPVDQAVANGTVYQFRAKAKKVKFWKTDQPLDGVWLQSADSGTMTWLSSTSGANASGTDCGGAPARGGGGGGGGNGCSSTNGTCTILQRLVDPQYPQDDLQAGTLSADRTEVEPGDVVNLTATPGFDKDTVEQYCQEPGGSLPAGTDPIIHVDDPRNILWSDSGAQGAFSDATSFSPTYTVPEEPPDVINLEAMYDDNTVFNDLAMISPILALVVQGPKLESQTVATTPANRQRTTIGVGEEVDLTLNPAPTNTVTWAVTGGGTISNTGPATARFTAPREHSSSTVTARFGTRRRSKSFTVIEPVGVHMEWAQTTISNVAPLGLEYFADIYITPDTVNFYGALVSEGTNNAVCTGYFTYMIGTPAAGHPPSPSPFPLLGGVVAGKGTRAMTAGGLLVRDRLRMLTQGPPYSNGTFTWSIPWFYHIGSLTNVITIVPQIATITTNNVTGKATLKLEKAGSTTNVFEP